MRRASIVMFLVAGCAAGSTRQPMPASVPVTSGAKLETVVRPGGGLDRRLYARITLSESAWVTLLGVMPSGRLTIMGQGTFAYGRFPAGTYLVPTAPQTPDDYVLATYQCAEPSVRVPSVPWGVHTTMESARTAFGAVSSGGGGGCGYHRGIIRSDALPRLFLLLTPERAFLAQLIFALGQQPDDLDGVEAAKALALRLNGRLIEQTDGQGLPSSPPDSISFP